MVSESTKTCPHYLMAATHVKQLLADRGGGQGELNSLPVCERAQNGRPSPLGFLWRFCGSRDVFSSLCCCLFCPASSSPPLLFSVRCKTFFWGLGASLCDIQKILSFPTCWHARPKCDQSATAGFRKVAFVFAISLWKTPS